MIGLGEVTPEQWPLRKSGPAKGQATPTVKAPTRAQIAARAREIRAGWTPAQWAAAQVRSRRIEFAIPVLCSSRLRTQGVELHEVTEITHDDE